jgi:ubiquinone/menaquinone biosynthesis C-methylase UbiE
MMCFEATPGFVSQARENVRKAGAHSVEIKQSIWNASALQKNSVDLFMSSHVLEHLPDLCTFLAELYDAMKPGGAVFTEVPNHNKAYIKKVLGGVFHLTLPTPQGFMNAMTAAGFVPVVETLVGNDEYNAVPYGYHIRSVFTKPPHPSITFHGVMGQ